MRYTDSRLAIISVSSVSKSPPCDYIQVTGADSIAAMLSVNCTLTSLNLGWNSIRMASAVTVAESLRDNHTLLSLGLAYNSFSDFASQVIFGDPYADAVFSLGKAMPNCEVPVPYYHVRYLLKHSTPHALATHPSRAPIACDQRLCSSLLATHGRGAFKRSRLPAFLT